MTTLDPNVAAAAINRHGYGLQHRAVAEAREAFEENKASAHGAERWLFEGIEMPVRVQEHDARIDIVLRDSQSRHFLAVECKRVNPAFGTWIFLRIPTVARGQDASWLQFDGALAPKPPAVYTFVPPVTVRTYRAQSLDDDSVHLGVEVKTEKKGDAEGSKTRELEATLSQAVLGANGLIQRWIERRDDLAGGPRFVLPMVVTTAELFVSSVEP